MQPRAVKKRAWPSKVKSRVGLGSIAILVLDISDRKKTAILLFIAVFTKTCELTFLLESFDLFTDLALQISGFCLQYCSYYSHSITNLASKRVFRHGKTVIIPKAIKSFH